MGAIAVEIDGCNDGEGNKQMEERVLLMDDACMISYNQMLKIRYAILINQSCDDDEFVICAVQSPALLV